MQSDIYKMCDFQYKFTGMMPDNICWILGMGNSAKTNIDQL